MFVRQRSFRYCLAVWSGCAAEGLEATGFLRRFVMMAGGDRGKYVDLREWKGDLDALAQNGERALTVDSMRKTVSVLYSGGALAGN